MAAARSWLARQGGAGEGWLALLIVVGEWTALARGVLGIPLVAGVLDALVILLLMHAIRTRRRNLRLHPLDVIVTAFVLLALVQMLNPNVPNPEIALEGFRKTAFTMIAYFIARLRAYSPARLAALVAAGSLLALVFGIRQFFVPLPLDLNIILTSGVANTTFYQANQLRAFSPMAGPFHLGLIASMVILFGLALAVARDARWLLAVMIGIVALVLSISRANWVATVVALALVASTAFPRAHISRRRVAVAAAAFAGGIAMVALVMLAVGGTTASRWEFYLQSVLNPLAARNIQLRFGYWEAMAAAFKSNPIVGYGTSSAADGFRRVYQEAGGSYFQPHSIYFKAALEMGIAGLVLMVSVLVIGLVEALRLRARAPVDAAVVMAAIVVVAVSGLTGPMLDAYPFNLLFWALLGGLGSLRAREAAA